MFYFKYLNLVIQKIVEYVRTNVATVIYNLLLGSGCIMFYS